MSTIAELFQEAAKSQGLTGLDFSQPQDGYFERKGLRFHYVDWGGSGFPIVFLHGGGQTCRTWDMSIVQIRGKYRCYALDQRNHGDSAKVKDVQVGPYEMREDARAFVKHLGLKQFVLVGMSMGGLNALAYASKYRKELKALCIVDVTPTIRPEGAKEIANFSRPVELSSIDEAVEAAIKFNPLRPPAHLRYSLMHALRQREDGKWVWKHQRPGDQRQPGEQTDEEHKTMTARYEKLWKDVAKIDCPALVFHGSKSQVINRELAEKLALGLHGEVVTIEGAGHTVQGDQPKLFIAELAKFLSKHKIQILNRLA